MSRVQLALNVSDLDEAVDFYSKLFATPPAKLRPGYANFAIADPPLKLVLFEAPEDRGTGVRGALNHLGIEVETTGEVMEAGARLGSEGLVAREESQTTCCHALQDKVWVTDPDGASWEVYAVLADAPLESDIDGDGTCCASTAQSTTVDRAARRRAASCC